MSIDNAPPPSRPPSLYGAYTEMGNDFPTFDDLPHLRDIYKKSSEQYELMLHGPQPVKVSKMRKMISLRAWLGYEHALALHPHYPDQSAKRLQQSQNDFQNYIDLAETREQASLGIKNKTLTGVLRAVNTDTTLDEIGLVTESLESTIFDKRNIGYLAEYAFSAIAMIPREGELPITPLSATYRQDQSPVGTALSRATDFNVFVPTSQQNNVVVENIVPTQVKSNYCWNYYDSSIAVVSMQGQFGLADYEDYPELVRHLKLYIQNQEPTTYLHSVREIISNIYRPTQEV